MKKNKKKEKINLATTLRNQADKKNNFDCAPLLEELNQASLEGEYSRTMQIKVNQADYIASLGLKVEKDRIGFYKISWGNEE